MVDASRFARRMLGAPLACALVAGLSGAGCIEEDNPLYCVDSSSCQNGFACDTTAHQCVQAPPGSDLAVAPDLTPMACQKSTDCKNPTPICTGGLCVACGTAAGDGGAPGDGGATMSECEARSAATPACLAGSCVGCVTNLDCVAKQLSCDSKLHTCTNPCGSNTDCGSGLCLQNGKCENPSNLIYVDSKACPGKGSGKFADPYCKVQDGVMAAAGGKTVIVQSGTYSEDVTIGASNGNVVATVVGLSHPILQPMSANAAALTVTGAMSHQLTLTMDGFTFQGSMLNGVSCTGAKATNNTQLTIVRSQVQTNVLLGVLATGCALTMDQDKIGPSNLGGGINLSDSDGQITNTAIFRNGATTAGVGGASLSTANLIVLGNVSIVDNTANAGTPAGVFGTALTHPFVYNTVIFGNHGGTSEVDTNSVQLAYSAFVGAPMDASKNVDITTCTAANLFTNDAMNDFHPVKGGKAPCTLVDQGIDAINGQTAPKYDLDGNPRPAGKGYDIGAYEAQ